MIGIELVKDRKDKTPLSEKETFNIVLDCATQGLLIYFRDNILGLMPPLIVDRGIADRIVEILDKVFETSVTAKLARTARLAKEFAVSRIK